jgi:hypothetical protein
MMAELKPCPFCGALLVNDGLECGWEHPRNECILAYADRRDDEPLYVAPDEGEDWNKRAESEELKFTRQFIHEQGLEFALAAAWERRKKDGK